MTRNLQFSFVRLYDVDELKTPVKWNNSQLQYVERHVHTHPHWRRVGRVVHGYCLILKLSWVSRSHTEMFLSRTTTKFNDYLCCFVLKMGLQTLNQLTVNKKYTWEHREEGIIYTVPKVSVTFNGFLGPESLTPVPKKSRLRPSVLCVVGYKSFVAHVVVKREKKPDNSLRYLI